MTITRRDVLWSLGGGLAGAAVTPLPWKLLDDTAIWTQRRHALPVPPRGPVTYRPTACTLCPAGCALRVRCVGTQPVAVVGEARHPLGGGACALGLTLHHLACHPLRLVGPAVRVNGRRESATLDAAVERIARAVENTHGAGLRVMVLDRRPGRVVSAAWQRLLAALPAGPLRDARRRRGDAGRPAGSAGKARHPRRRPRANAHARELRRAGAGGMGTAGEDARRAPGPARRAGRRLALALGRPRRRVGCDLAGRRRTAGPGPRARRRARAGGCGQRRPAAGARGLLAARQPHHAPASSRTGSRRSRALSSGSRRPSRSAAATREPVPFRPTPSGRSPSSTWSWAAWAVKADSSRVARCPRPAPTPSEPRRPPSRTCPPARWASFSSTRPTTAAPCRGRSSAACSRRAPSW